MAYGHPINKSSEPLPHVGANSRLCLHPQSWRFGPNHLGALPKSYDWLFWHIALLWTTMESLAQIVEQIKLNKDNLLTNDSGFALKSLTNITIFYLQIYFGRNFLFTILSKKSLTVVKMIYSFSSINTWINSLRISTIYQWDFSCTNIFNINQLTLQPKIEVMRNISPKLPLHLCSINWEETLFLNLILQKLEYSILFSVCTRTSSNHYQVLTKQKLALFATPSSHSVLCKESTEQYSYPYINFYIENFEEVFILLQSTYCELIGVFCSFYTATLSMISNRYTSSWWPKISPLLTGHLCSSHLGLIISL